MRKQGHAEKAEQHPDNYFGHATLAIARGQLMKVLHDYAFVLENGLVSDDGGHRIETIKDEIRAVSCDSI